MEHGESSFGEWLLHQLSKRELSQRRFAAELNVSGVTVSKWVRGATRPEMERIPEIAAILDVPQEEIWHALTDGQSAALSDATLASLLGLPVDLTLDEIILMRHLFRAVRAYEREKGLLAQEPSAS